MYQDNVGLDLGEDKSFLEETDELTGLGVVLELDHDRLEGCLVVEAEGGVVEAGLLEVLVDEVVQLIALD